jgi:hypothetical protein
VGCSAASDSVQQQVFASFLNFEERVRDPVTGRRLDKPSKHGALDGGYWGNVNAFSRRTSKEEAAKVEAKEEKELVEALSASLRDRPTLWRGMAVEAKDDLDDDEWSVPTCAKAKCDVGWCVPTWCQGWV